jgi:hypothetical protein
VPIDDDVDSGGDGCFYSSDDFLKKNMKNCEERKERDGMEVRIT